jgi:hypothetical protein
VIFPDDVVGHLLKASDLVPMSPPAGVEIEVEDRQTGARIVREIGGGAGTLFDRVARAFASEIDQEIVDAEAVRDAAYDVLVLWWEAAGEVQSALEEARERCACDFDPAGAAVAWRRADELFCALADDLSDKTAYGAWVAGTTAINAWASGR